MARTGGGRGLMVAGGIVSVIGLGIVLVKALSIPRYWVPLVAGVGLFLIGLVRWTMSRRS